MFSKDEFEELQKVHPRATVAQEVGIAYILLPSVTLWEKCTPKTVDCLFCPVGRDGYPSRLFFSERITSPTERNWHQTARILERNWITYSWRVNHSGLRLLQILGAHLEALK